MLIEVEPVEKVFEIDDDTPVVVKQVKITAEYPEVFLDPDQVIDLINHLEFALKEINGE